MKKLLTLMSTGFLALAVLIILPGISSADAAAFMKIADIKGEASDKDHQDWIIIESMSPPLKPTGQATGRRQHKPLTITKTVDKASPMLQRASNSGRVFPTVIIEVSKYGGNRATYLKYELTNVMITSYSVNDPGTAGEVPMESFSLNYSEIEYKYDAQKEKREKKYKKDR